MGSAALVVPGDDGNSDEKPFFRKGDISVMWGLGQNPYPDYYYVQQFDRRSFACIIGEP
jgi:hypothetical protein